MVPGVIARELHPQTGASAGDGAQHHVEEIALALRVQASRILELEAEVDRLDRLASGERGEGLTAECAALRAELDAVYSTKTLRVLAFPRRVHGILLRNRLDVRCWARDVRRWMRSRRR